jgi:phosphoribosyl-ATP pyrophosphohydrolase
MNYLTDLQKIIQSKKNRDPDQSYTAQLFFKGLEEIQKKFGEEAIELIIASASKNKTQTIYESADVLFHLLVLLTENNISIEEIVDELKKRSGVSGLEEKSNRKK